MLAVQPDINVWQWQQHSPLETADYLPVRPKTVLQFMAVTLTLAVISLPRRIGQRKLVKLLDVRIIESQMNFKIKDTTSCVFSLLWPLFWNCRILKNNIFWNTWKKQTKLHRNKRHVMSDLANKTKRIRPEEVHVLSKCHPDVEWKKE